MSHRFTQGNFETKFQVGAGCWPWLGAKHGKGYGHVKRLGKVEKAHRVSYETYIGPVPDGKMVLHRCDTPSCVSPFHLFLGDNAANMADMKAKGRGNGPRGEKCHLAKLNAAQVIAIRLDERGPTAIAKEYGVSATLICDIKHRKCWRHI